MKHLYRASLLALFGAGAFMATAPAAKAAVVCNGEGVCWHVRHPYAYPPAYGVVVHPNGWRWGPGEHYVWREHRGRGYWRGGAWVAF